MPRSIDFSRATASAICNSSSRLALTAIGHSPSCWARVPRCPADAGRNRRLSDSRALIVVGLACASRSAGLAAPQRFGDQRVGRARAWLPPCRRSAAARRPARRPAASSRRMRAASPSTPSSMPRKRLRPSTATAISILTTLAGIALEIRAAHQRPVDAGRGDLQPIGALDRIGDVEHRRQRARDRLAILDRHRAVRPLRHDLHGAAVDAGDAHPHQPIAEARRAPARRSRRRAPPRPGSAIRRGSSPDASSISSFIRLMSLSSLLLFHSARPAIRAIPVTKKSGSRGAHSQKPIGSTDRYEMSIAWTAANIAICLADARVWRRRVARRPGMANGSFTITAIFNFRRQRGRDSHRPARDFEDVGVRRR